MKRNRFSEAKGPSQRQLRVAEVIRRALAEIFARGDLYDPELAHVSLTVGEVRTSPDLRVATVFVLPLGGQESEVAIGALNRSAGEIRRLLNRRITLKFSPELRFVADESFDRMDETRRLLGENRVRRDLDHGTNDD
ncbi:MAG: 30S ribosome-binding factor RbfA [Paracoccaceae bacterium]